MGVMSCYRNGCGNILCDIYVPSIGYICYECKDEFKTYLENKGMDDITEGYINRELEKFMDTTKGHYDGTKIDIDDFFDKYSG